MGFSCEHNILERCDECEPANTYSEGDKGVVLIIAPSESLRRGSPKNVVLSAFQSRYEDQVNSARGEGFFAAINARDAAHRDKIVGALRREGNVLPWLCCASSAIKFP